VLAINDITGPYALNATEHAGRVLIRVAPETHYLINIKFDASLTVPTSTENRPKNINITYEIFINA
jgi:hypothetical protein